VIKRFPGDKLHEIIEKYPDVSKHLFSVLAARLGYANKITIKLANDLAAKNGIPGARPGL
jgi:type IV pilus assembly protein PilB